MNTMQNAISSYVLNMIDNMILTSYSIKWPSFKFPFKIEVLGGEGGDDKNLNNFGVTADTFS